MCHSASHHETYVQRNFASPMDTWALSDAKVMMETAQGKKAAFLFPVEKMFPMLQKVSVRTLDYRRTAGSVVKRDRDDF